VIRRRHFVSSLSSLSDDEESKIAELVAGTTICQIFCGFPLCNYFSTIALVEKHTYYENTGCRVFKKGIQNLKDFCLKITLPKEIIEF
jgi:hypothetical protein